MNEIQYFSTFNYNKQFLLSFIIGYELFLALLIYEINLMKSISYTFPLRFVLSLYINNQ